MKLILMSRLKKIIFDDNASPMVEEGLLIGLAIMIFIAILSIANDLITWVKMTYDQISTNQGLIYALFLK